MRPRLAGEPAVAFSGALTPVVVWTPVAQDDEENAAHLIVRTEFNSQFRGVTILSGWNVF